MDPAKGLVNLTTRRDHAKENFHRFHINLAGAEVTGESEEIEEHRGGLPHGWRAPRSASGVGAWIGLAALPAPGISAYVAAREAVEA
jgi:hypothetical protein